MALFRVRMMGTGSVMVVDDSDGRMQMERAEPYFFRNRHGMRETFSVYRGCLIVRSTRRYSNGQRERVTTPYLFGEYEGQKGKSTLCMSANGVNTVRQAQKLIDRVLGGRRYWYGMKESEDSVRMTPAGLMSCHKTSVAVSLAGVVAAGDFSSMPILADALSDAGFNNQETLGWMRDPTFPWEPACGVLKFLLS